MPQWIDTFNIMDDTSKEKLENKESVMKDLIGVGTIAKVYKTTKI